MLRPADDDTTRQRAEEGARRDAETPMASVEESNAGARMAFCVARGLKRSVANRCCLTGDSRTDDRLLLKSGGPK